MAIQSYHCVSKCQELEWKVSSGNSKRATQHRRRLAEVEREMFLERKPMRDVFKDPRTTAKTLGNLLANSTVTRILHWKTPLLQKRRLKVRLKCAKDNLERDHAYWKCILWSDEMKLEPAAKVGLGRHFVLQDDSNPKHTSFLVKNSLPKTNVNIIEWPISLWSFTRPLEDSGTPNIQLLLNGCFLNKSRLKERDWPVHCVWNSNSRVLLRFLWTIVILH